VVFSCEGSRVESDQLSLTTAGIGAVVLNVKGRASHAGDVPEHSNDAEYVEIDSIEPRLYLFARMIMDVAQGKAN
jgi:acetylornithine deacetylase/succinyl-diaminopimelate desuccinylase-like protein